MLAGVELRKRRRLGEVLSDSFSILFAHWRQLAAICVPVIAANIAFALVVLALTNDLPTAEEIQEDSSVLTDAHVNRLAALVGLSVFVALPLFFILQALVTAAGVAYLDEADRSTGLHASEALDRAQANLGPLIGATLRATAIVLALAITIVGIPWAIHRGVRWIFLSQVIMLEERRGQAVLARSAELVRGRWWSTFGRLIVVALVISIPVGLLQQALMAAAPGVLGTVLSSATGFITVPYGIIAVSLMFFDLRMEEWNDDSPSTPGEPAP